jgi:hypothetical protein
MQLEGIKIEVSITDVSDLISRVTLVYEGQPGEAVTWVSARVQYGAADSDFRTQISEFVSAGRNPVTGEGPPDWLIELASHVDGGVAVVGG